MVLKFIDLFCGIGGFHQAISRLGGECVMACDKDERCTQIYKANYGIDPLDDITKLDVSQIPSFDILCAGFPCQPFSKAGFQNGFADTEGTLFYNICEIAKAHSPKYMILENVRHLENHDEGNTWKTIYIHIISLGYYTYETPLIFNVLHFNIPQNRERVIILCKRKDLGKLPPRPSLPRKSQALQMLSRTLDSFVDAKYNSRENELPEKLKEVKKVWNKFIRLCHDNSIEIPKCPIWTDVWNRDSTTSLESSERNSVLYKKWIVRNRKFYEDHYDILNPWLADSRKNEFWVGAMRKFEWQVKENPLADLDGLLWSCRASGVRVKDPNYVPTLVAMNHTPVYGPYNRKLVPEELLKLQSFGENFFFHKKYIHKQIGNAVNVDMIYHCAAFLINNTPFPFAS